MPEEKTRDEITKQILNESRNIEKIVNGDLLDKFCKIHNISSEYSMFNIKQEVVCLNALFFDVKKHYCLQIINKEGIPTNKLECKGVVTQRSEYPSLTKERITTLIEFVLQEEVIDFRKIRKFIDDTEKEIIQLCEQGDKSIAKVVTYTKSDYKVVPSHVMGMHLWNDLEYNYFDVQTKGYHYKILGVDRSKAPDRIIEKIHNINLKNTCIVIPYEEERLPEYYVVDIENMMKYAWHDRYADLLSPIYNKIFPIEKTNQAIVDLDKIFI